MQDGGTSRLSVRDEGGGLPAGATDQVFERFYRGRDAAMKSGGVGLGLTIARNLAEAQKGTLAMAAEEKDTCFILSLPAATPPSPPVDRRDAKAALRHLRVMDR